MDRKKYKPRIAVYTHDTFGLGHVRRCMHIISRLSLEMPESAILLVTGSPALHYLKNLPPNVDIVKIPTLVKTGAFGSLPPHIPLGLPELVEIRSRIIKETVLSIDPDIFIVDNFPLGANSELLPLLKSLKIQHTKTILGLRDIVECPEAIRSEWKRNDVYDAIDRYYDKVLIYGVQEMFDAIKEYRIPEKIQKKVHFCGYLTGMGPVPPLAENIKEKYGVKGPLILATGGGGGDAFPLLSALIEAVENIPDSHTLIFSGPLMGEKDRQDLIKNINGNPNIVLNEFVQDLRPYFKEADLLVAMCGYNIASEIVLHKTKAVIAPRTWRFGEHSQRTNSKEEKEQIMRGRLMAQHGYVSLLEPGELNPENLTKTILCALKTPLNVPSHNNFAINGLQNAVNHIMEYL